MILLDFSGLAISSVYGLLRVNDDIFDEKLYKQSIFRSILGYKKRFSDKYGKLIVCCDAESKTYWRIDAFPHYKTKRAGARKTQQDSIDIDWKDVYRSMDQILDDLDNIFPYKIMSIDKMEADDIIGVLAKEKIEPTMIVSRDHDFNQLQVYKHVRQYDPVTKKLFNAKNPKKELLEHIIRGDRGDGIPNITTDNDIWTKEGGRQKRLTTKKVNEWLTQEPIEFCESPEILRRYKENRLLIDLSCIPDKYVKLILEEFEVESNGHNKYIFNYLTENQLSSLMTDINHLKEKQ
jgi:hypothetical protein